jgi:hypothetical protein
MPNALAVGTLIGKQRVGSRPFLLGFEAFGAMALAFFVALATCVPRAVVDVFPARPISDSCISPIDEFLTPGQSRDTNYGNCGSNTLVCA